MLAPTRSSSPASGGGVAKAWKWLASTPVTVGLLVALTVSTGCLVAALLVSQSQTREAAARAAVALEKANADRDRALADRDKVAADLQQALQGEKITARKALTQAYNLGFVLAGREWVQANVAAAREHLHRAPAEVRGWEWHYLAGQLNPGINRTIPTPADDELRDVRFTRDGLLVVHAFTRAQGQALPYVEVTDPRTGAVQRRWTGKADRDAPEITAVAVREIDADAKRLVVALTRKEAGKPVTTWQVRDLASGKVLAKLPDNLIVLHGFTADGARLLGLTGTREQRSTAKLVTLAADSGSVVRTFTLDAGDLVREVVLDPHKPRAALNLARAAGIEIAVLDLDSGKEVARIKPPTPDAWRNTIPQATFAAKERFYVVADTCTEYDLTTGNALRTLGTGSVRRLDLHPHGGHLALGYDRTTTLLDATGKTIRELPYGAFGNQIGVTLGPDGTTAIWTRYIWDELGVKLLSPTDSSRWSDVRLPGTGTTHGHASPDLRFVAALPMQAGAKDGAEVRFLDGITGTACGTLPYLSERRPDFVLGPGGSYASAEVEGKNQRVRVYRIGGTAPVLVGERTWDAGSRGELLAVSAQGHVVRATGTALQLWQAGGAAEPILLEEPRDAAPRARSRAVFSADGKLLALVTETEKAVTTLHVWEVPSGQVRLRVTLDAEVEGLTFSPTGERLFVAQRPRGGTGTATVATWKLPTGEAEQTFWQGSVVFPKAFTSDGKFLAGTGAEGLEVWDAVSGQRLWRVAGATAGVRFVDGGRRLAAVRGDGQRAQLMLFDAQSGAELLTLPDAPGAAELGYDAESGTLTAFGGDDRGGQRLRLWVAPAPK